MYFNSIKREVLENHRIQEAETENMRPQHLENDQELFLALQKPARSQNVNVDFGT